MNSSTHKSGVHKYTLSYKKIHHFLCHDKVTRKFVEYPRISLSWNLLFFIAV